MDIVIAGGHGQVARRLARRLAARGDRVRALVRNPDHVIDCRSDGAEAVVLDLEEAEMARLTAAISGADAVVFAAGAGPGSGAPRKETVDHGAAVLLLSAAQRAAVERYVMISAMGTDDPPTDDAVFSVYLRAKARADEEVMRSDRAWTIVRPGRLTDDPGTGRVRLARHVERGEVPRDDVAAVIAAVLARPDTAGHVFEVTSGDTPVDEAIDGLTGPRQ